MLAPLAVTSWWAHLEPAALATQRGVYPGIFGFWWLGLSRELGQPGGPGQGARALHFGAQHGCVTQAHPWNIRSFFLDRPSLRLTGLEFKRLPPPKDGDPFAASQFSQLVGVKKPILPQTT